MIRIAREWQFPIEEVAGWPTNKLLLYREALIADGERKEEQTPDVDVPDVEDVDPSEFR